MHEKLAGLEPTLGQIEQALVASEDDDFGAAYAADLPRIGGEA